jgi:hypothetical protein
MLAGPIRAIGESAQALDRVLNVPNARARRIFEARRLADEPIT